MKGFVADTMAIILWLERRKMPQNAKALFISAEKGQAKIYIPAIVLAEVGYLTEKNRIDVTLNDMISYADKHENIISHSLDHNIVRRAFEIKDIPELHDRLISAYGRFLGCPIITNDPVIIASRFVSAVWD